MINPNWMSILNRSLRTLPRTAMRTAGKVVRDIGSKDPAVARAALKMVGMHAAVGSAAGGAYAYATGGDVRGGMLRGGIAGGALGMAGGTRMLTNVYQRGYAAAARQTYMGALSRGMGQGMGTAEGRRMVYQAMRSAEQRGLFGAVAPMPKWAGRVNNFMDGGDAWNAVSGAYGNVRGAARNLMPSGNGGSVIAAGRRTRPIGGGYGSSRRVAGRRRR